MIRFFIFALMLVASHKAVAETEGRARALRVENGVALTLAEYRKANLSDIHYQLHFNIPKNQNDVTTARETVTFTLKSTEQDIQLDFKESADKVKSVNVNGQSIAVDHRNEHLIIAARTLRVGKNTVEITFEAGTTSLNRNPDYLYTLFVPDRARTAFPLFDQPNLKATYDLTLEVPASWTALSNSPLLKSEERGERQLFVFDKSDKISSYLFSFVAGEFETVTRTLDGRSMTLLHRETDDEKVARNLDGIFELHRASLEWLEDYTGIPYPFKKFDFALIPAFQYGGMEHVGAIQYRASSLFLDKNPSDNQLLNRANLIAHETAHMWFGNLVTMDWFNDVWTKEVYANFMAAKIVNPSFPDVDHDLNFLVRSYPAAYSVDRTEGANPIRQHLPNLNEAGTLYGAIIYNKAPIMMQQLELLLGEEEFQSGIQEYLKTFADSNATWPDLVGIFDERSEQDIRKWSNIWVNTPGRPEFRWTPEGNLNGLKQFDPQDLDRIWPQQFEVSGRFFKSRLPIVYSGTKVPFSASASDVLNINTDGKGYGLFPVSLEVINENWHQITPLQKGAMLINLYEQLLDNNPGVKPVDYLEFLMRGIAEEENQLVLNLALGHIRSIYWQLLTMSEREEAAAALETLLWNTMTTDGQNAVRVKIYFNLYQNIALSTEGLDRLEAIWREELEVTNLILSENDLTVLAGTLAVKRPAKAEDITSQQLLKISNPDRRRRFAFIKPSLSADKAERDAFFNSLKDVDNRAVESWVLAALGYLHHPLRTEESTDYILPSLELMAEIQQTGDIFFPARWSAVNLQNHKSKTAEQTVRNFLQERPNYNHQLKLKILQAADPIFRANRILGH